MAEDIFNENCIHGDWKCAYRNRHKKCKALEEKADRLDELLVIYKRHYGNVIEYSIELQEKAEKYDMIQECVPLVHHLTFEQFVKEYRILTKKLEAVHVLLRKSDGMDLADSDVRTKLLQNLTEASGEGKKILGAEE